LAGLTEPSAVAPDVRVNFFSDNLNTTINGKWWFLPGGRRSILQYTEVHKSYLPGPEVFELFD
jgi:hypothetical protein